MLVARAATPSSSFAADRSAAAGGAGRARGAALDSARDDRQRLPRSEPRPTRGLTRSKPTESWAAPRPDPRGPRGNGRGDDEPTHGHTAATPVRGRNPSARDGLAHCAALAPSTRRRLGDHDEPRATTLAVPSPTRSAWLPRSAHRPLSPRVRLRRRAVSSGCIDGVGGGGYSRLHEEIAYACRDGGGLPESAEGADAIARSIATSCGSPISPSRSASSRSGASSTTSPTTRCAPTCCSSSPTWRAAPQRAQLGSMVVVLPWHDPMRVAEEIVDARQHLATGA